MRYLPQLHFTKTCGLNKSDLESKPRIDRLCVAIALLLVGALAPDLRAGSPASVCSTAASAAASSDSTYAVAVCETGGSGASSAASAADVAAEWNSRIQSAPSRTISAPNSTTAVSATVTPTTIDETFADFIHVSISGIATGDSVRVEKFQVNNTNGVIDATAILQQSFLLTDGKSNLIGGVVNMNVPADSTPADGSISAQISFLDDSVPNTVGEYVFRFSSPTNAFTPITKRFTVTAVPDAQNISGTVTASGAPLPNAYVVLLNTEGGGYTFYAATIADAAGNYSFGANPGQYDQVAAQRGYVGAFGKGVEQTLAAGQNKTVNITMVQGTRTISGKVRDSKTSEGLPAVQVVFRSADGKFTVDYTDANGNFSTRVTPGSWDLEIERNAVNQIGYLAPSNPMTVDTSSADVNNVAISLPRATALFYGKLTDTNSNPLPGEGIDSTDERNQFQAFTATDNNGNYVIAISSGVWDLGATASALQEKGYLSPFPSAFYVQDGQAIRADFTAKKSNAQFGGALTDNNGAGVSDISFRAADKTTKRFTDFGTEAGGAFNVAFADGTWSVTPEFASVADTDLIFITPPPFVVSAGQTLSNISLRAQQPTRHVILHLIDNTGAVYEGARIKITTTAGGTTYTAYAFTDVNGEANLPAFDGTWTLIGNGPELFAGGFRNLTSQTITISGSDANLSMQLQLLPATGNTLVNLSTRGTVQTGDNVLIGGFIVPGHAPKKVLIRAIGPSLANFGVNGALSDPTLTLFDGGSNQIGFNDNWMDSPDKQAIIDTTAFPSNDKESAIIATLAPGNYTAKVAGAGNATGVALVELYDLDSFSSSTLANISTRGRINQGDNVLIAGYIVGGYKPQRVVVRAIGPSLSQFGVSDALADPFLELHDAQGTIIMSNNDWQDTQKQELIDTTIPPSNTKESALVTNLTPGNYTAVVSGVGGTTGVGLAEVYNITGN
jgi:Carboxypeptidase regulatory-like domain